MRPLLLAILLCACGIKARPRPPLAEGEADAPEAQPASGPAAPDPLRPGPGEPGLDDPGLDEGAPAPGSCVNCPED